MKTFTKNLVSSLVVLLVMIVTTGRAQSWNFSVSPQTQCYSTSGNTVMAVSTSSSATSITWSVMSTGCPGSLSSFSGTSTQATFSCCGVYTIAGTAFSGSTSLGMVTKTVNIVCTNFLSIVNPSTLTICQGNTAVITASGATSYTWSVGAPFASISVSPSVNTCYTVVGTNGSGCTSAAVACVTVGTGVHINGNNSLCAGNSTTLTATGSSSYTWSPTGSNASSIVVTPTSNICYYVTGSGTTNCNNTDSICINIISQPSLTLSGNGTVCAGNGVSLMASGATSYTWNPGGIVSPTLFATPSVNTCYTVTGLYPGCGLISAVKCVTVIPSPTISVTGNMTVCAGSSSTLTASGATSYTWMTPAGTMTGTSIVFTPTASTCFSVIGNSGSACNGVTGVCVNVQQSNISISGPSVVCAGSSATLTANGMSTYTWQPGNIAGNTLVITPSVSSCYSVSGTGVTGCTGSGAKCITVQALPVITTSVLGSNCAGATRTFVASGAFTYTWTPFLSGGSSVVFTPTAGGCYTVMGSSAAGCIGSASNCYSVIPGPTVSVNSVSICPGQSATLTATGANTYIWQPGNLSGGSIVVTPGVSTCYTVTGNANGCTGAAVACVTVAPANLAINGPSVLCTGGSAVLTGSGSTTFTWLPGNIVSNTILVTPSVSTCYTVLGTSFNGCPASAVKCITLTQTFYPVFGPNIVCLGSSAVLTATSANTSFTWYPGNVVSSSLAITPTVTSCYTLSAVNAQGCTGTTVKCVTVSPLPVITAVASSSVFCAGNSYTLTASGANNYTWVPYNQTGSSIVITPTAAGCYTVIGSNGTCVNSSAPYCFSVTPAPVVTISGTNVICSGSSTTLTASGAGTYTWLPSGTNGPNLVVSPVASTCYTLIGSNGGCSSSAVHCVTVMPTTLSVTGPSVMCAGSSATLVASGAGSYTWLPGGLSGSGIVVSPSVTTCYTVLGTNGNCQASAVKCVSVTQTPVVTTTATSGFFCAGSTRTLYASGATTYTWLPFNQTGPQITITPTASMCYTVIGSTGPGCTGYAVNCFSVMPAPTVTVTGITSLCTGSSSTLTVSGATTYTWIPGGSNATSIVISPTASTCYTVIGSNGGCTGSAVKCVSVTPGVLTISGPSVICNGGTATLSAPGSTSYTWLPGNQSGSSIVISPTATTCYTVLATNGNGCFSSGVKCVSVQSGGSLAISGNTNICQGSTTSFLATGANTYTWNIGSNNALITVLPSTNTCFYVSGTLPGGCIATGSVCVNVNPLPVVSISGTNTICKGQSTFLVASGAASYTWNTGAISHSIMVSPTTSTVYTVIGKTSAGCSASASMTVVVKPNPVLTLVADTTICKGDSVHIFANGAQSYVWSNNMTTPSILVTPFLSSIYTVTGTTNGCSSVASIYINVSPCTGLAKMNSLSGVSFFPNPSRGQLSFVSPENKTISYTISDMAGRMILNGSFNGSATISVGEISNGCYLVRLSDGLLTSHHKLVIEK